MRSIQYEYNTSIIIIYYEIKNVNAIQLQILFLSFKSLIDTVKRCFRRWHFFISTSWGEGDALRLSTICFHLTAPASETVYRFRLISDQLGQRLPDPTSPVNHRHAHILSCPPGLVPGRACLTTENAWKQTLRKCERGSYLLHVSVILFTRECYLT